MEQRWLPFVVGLTVGVLVMLPFAWRPTKPPTADADELRAQLFQAIATAEELRRNCRGKEEAPLPNLSRQRTERPQR